MSLSFPLLALPLSILTRCRHMNTGDHIKSIEALQRALVIREEALGAGHPAVADILVNLIAAMRLSAEKMPLAQGWEHKEDAEGKSYWYNPGKQTVQYDRPLPDAFCDGSGGRTLKDLEIRLCSLESQSSMSANFSSSDVLLGLQARCPPPPHFKHFICIDVQKLHFKTMFLGNPSNFATRNYLCKAHSRRALLDVFFLSSATATKAVVLLLNPPFLFTASAPLVRGENSNIILANCTLSCCCFL